jgi:hypothetical protein
MTEEVPTEKPILECILKTHKHKQIRYPSKITENGQLKITIRMLKG